MEGDIIMKREAFMIARRYRKCFVRLAIKYPKDSLKYWYIYYDQLNGLLDLLSYDKNITSHEYMLMVKYFYKKFQELHIIYCE